MCVMAPESCEHPKQAVQLLDQRMLHRFTVMTSFIYYKKKKDFKSWLSPNVSVS